MSAQLTVINVTVLSNGKVLLVGNLQGAEPPMGTKASTASGEIEIEIVSQAIVDPVERESSNKLFQVQLLKGDIRLLKGQVLSTK